jgi:hypothetical protein
LLIFIAHFPPPERRRKKERTMKKCLLVTAIIASSASSQISITSSDVPHTIGDRLVSTADSVSQVRVGHAGGPQHWQFQLVNPCEVETTYIRPVGESPVLDSFPTTNLLYVTVTAFDTLGGIHYAHYDLSRSSLQGLGWIAQIPPFTTVVVYHPASMELQFPMGYDSTWASSFNYTVVLDSLLSSYTVTAVDRESVVDAWGTVTTPMGTFDALRSKTTSTTITDTYFMGMLLWSDTSHTLGFSWTVPDYGAIVNVLGDSVSEDTLVLAPSCYSIMTYSTVSVKEDRDPPVNVASRTRVLGNPTSLPLRIEFDIQQRQDAVVEIYDLSGRLVHRFDDVKPPVFVWDGIAHNGYRIPSGKYIVRVRTRSVWRSFIVTIL